MSLHRAKLCYGFAGINISVHKGLVEAWTMLLDGNVYTPTPVIKGIHIDVDVCKGVKNSILYGGI